MIKSRFNQLILTLAALAMLTPQNLLKFMPSGSVALLLGGIISTSLATNPAGAAEQLIVTYGAYQASFAVSDLEILANTGETSASIGFYLELAGLTPEQLRSVLTTQFDVSHNVLDDMLNTEGGEYLLSEVTQVIHTPSQQANIQALRSSLILSASDDRQVSLLELLQKYPTQQVYVNGANLVQLANELNVEQKAERKEEEVDEWMGR